MGPLVPDVITDELNLLVALIAGILFGFVLEQAGFSSSRKLTGLFYGTDFTVLRVFFTAGVTAMIGVVLLDSAGLLDTSVIYVHPTFVTSALVGGTIMGVGFVVGGYCPGTSFCGAAVGRIDAMLFVLGGLLGAFAFGEAFPRLQGVYGAWSLQDLTLPAAIGVSPGTVVIAWAVIAIGAFVVTGAIERRVSRHSDVRRFPLVRHRLAAVALLGTAVVAASAGRADQRLLAQVSADEYRRSHPVKHVTADEIAFRILDGDDRLLLVDTRPAPAFAAFSLPRSVNVPPADLFGKASRDRLARRGELKVFFAEDERTATTAALAAQRLGYEDVAVLQGGLATFRAEYLDPGGFATAPNDDTREFRAAAGPRIAELIRDRGRAKPVTRKVKKVAGGCGV